VKGCVFCDIAAGRAPATIVIADPEVVAFRDLNPQAPVHVLVIPRRHIGSAAELTQADDTLWGRMLRMARSVAEQQAVADRGYRLVTNIGRESGQTVDHLHLHVLGGRPMTWPPG
jgi:histidine triad (HIT) family protein